MPQPSSQPAPSSSSLPVGTAVSGYQWPGPPGSGSQPDWAAAGGPGTLLTPTESLSQGSKTARWPAVAAGVRRCCGQFIRGRIGMTAPKPGLGRPILGVVNRRWHTCLDFMFDDDNNRYWQSREAVIPLPSTSPCREAICCLEYG